jgi:hypothetical protein
MLQILIGTLVVMISAVEIRISVFSVEENKIPKLLKRLVLFLRRKRKTKVESSEGNEQNTQTGEHGLNFGFIIFCDVTLAKKNQRNKIKILFVLNKV